MKHIANVVVLIIIVTVVVAFGLESIQLLPVPASEEAELIDHLFGMHLQVIAFLFALISVFMVYSIVVFRRKPGEEGDGDHFHGNTALEIVWTAVPLIIVLYFSYLGSEYLYESMEAEDNELVIEVTASQWAWRYDYPEYGISDSDLYMPKDRQALFKMTSIDVIHSFWVPEFRVKQDTVPGMTKELRLKPTTVGHYRVRCAEMCGQDHAYMLSEVEVMEPADFDAWVAGKQDVGDLTPAERGAEAYQLRGCNACHTLDGTETIGPSWQGLFGSEKTLTDGTTVVADEEYIRQAIIKPNDQVVEGFAPIMPQTYEEQIPPEEINDIIEYIKSLSN
jgi:cytochrome c oxidase subunit 2